MGDSGREGGEEKYGFGITDAHLERNDWKFPTNLKCPLLSKGKYSEFITIPDRKRGSSHFQREYIYLKLIYVPLPFDTTKLLVPAEFRGNLFEEPPQWITKDYWHMQENDSGGSSAMTKEGKSEFILQTPNDGEPFCSLFISESRPNGSKMSSCRGLYIAHEKEYGLQNLLGSQPLSETDEPVCKFHAMFMALPIRIIQTHAKITHSKLLALTGELNKMEIVINKGNVSKNAEEYNKKLYEMSLRQTKIQQRCQFELDLSASILQYLETAAAKDNGRLRHDVKAYIKPMRDQVETEIRFSQSSKRDIDTLSQKIRNQSKAIISLQNTEIAQSSRRDGASMKTIAALTLIFLPGTAVASIFSMTMFNWQAGPDEQVTSGYLWLYFAVAVPLTILILAAWLFYYFAFQTRENQFIQKLRTWWGQRTGDLENQLPHPPSGNPASPTKGEKGL